MNDTLPKRRKLDASELLAADALRRAVRSAPHPADWFAAKLGVTYAALQQWMAGVAVVPLKRVALLAHLLGCDPSDISVEWRESVSPYLDPSHAARLDSRRMESLIATVDSAASGQVIPISSRLKARIITRLYADGIGDDPEETVRKMLASILSALETDR